MKIDLFLNFILSYEKSRYKKIKLHVKTAVGKNNIRDPHDVFTKKTLRGSL
ncbi:hypothetical protein Bccel_3349 [Pseudobacteroides cellulosolvens ATCC 35603 = DSM 2933]|uniref:Uncharacterized protein n=1 Tax=Pseudobacteroides cellulosolvens ATCC 35603 = DSM 2933 TaxID=398512 RepID=A0A0L6JQL7_9FIRM|nr:hypothetical protein Bccel_3349 [Pseudobacteroides cellulosolvens ATCC 35603 = DSM 2933]